jgi:hypothetical protein
MKTYTIALAASFVLAAIPAFAQGNPSGPGAVTGDPAASSQSGHRDTSGMAPNRSGSGTSTSGGKDDNGDQGRDKMPESNMNVRPAPGKPDIPNPAR